jgi:Integrase core domain
MNIVDDYSSCPWGFALKRKSDATQVFQDWKLQVEWESGKKLGIVCTDGGGEYSSSEYKAILRREGVMHQTSAPYTSAQNGRSECLHWTIMGRARAMRSDAKLLPNLWAECAMAAFYLAQRTPTHTLQGMTPYEAFYGKKPWMSHLREYGCQDFVLIQSKVNPKIYPHSEECVLVGYSTDSKAYQCWNRKTQHIVTSYNVNFIESQDSIPQPLTKNQQIEDDSGNNHMLKMQDDSEVEDGIAEEQL